MKLTQHPLSAAFPPMMPEEFQDLKDDIEVHGQREPVVVLNDMVLDGWHRYSACIELCLAVRQVTLPPDEDPVQFVLSQNLKRRHLTALQRAAAAAECTSWAPSGRPNNLAMAASFSTNKELAKAAGVSERTVSLAKTAIKAGLGDAVKSGKVTAKQVADRSAGKAVKPGVTKDALPKRAPCDVPSPDAGEPEPAELAATQRDVAEEVETLRKIVHADDKLAAAVAEMEQLRARSAVQQARIDDLLDENGKLLERVRVLQAKLDAREREVQAA